MYKIGFRPGGGGGRRVGGGCWQRVRSFSVWTIGVALSYASLHPSVII